LDYNMMLKLKLRAYVQLYMGTTNRQASRSVGVNSTEPFKRGRGVLFHVTQDRKETTWSHLEEASNL